MFWAFETLKDNCSSEFSFRWWWIQREYERVSCLIKRIYVFLGLETYFNSSIPSVWLQSHPQTCLVRPYVPSAAKNPLWSLLLSLFYFSDLDWALVMSTFFEQSPDVSKAKHNRVQCHLELDVNPRRFLFSDGLLSAWNPSNWCRYGRGQPAFNVWPRTTFISLHRRRLRDRSESFVTTPP